MSNYTVLVNGHPTINFSGDFRQASSPIFLEGDATPFQVADASHYPRRAARLLNDWLADNGGAMWDDEEDDFEVVEVDS